MIKIRYMMKEDYSKVYQLWLSIDGFAIRSVDDSEEGIIRVIDRNPDISVVALDGDNIIGAILAGHDGRTGSLYHVCVHKDYRGHRVGTLMTQEVMKAFRREKINQVALVAFSDNDGGNAFWNDIGWKMRTDLNYYYKILNSDNHITKVKIDC